ncbi:MAG: argininosuccinate synthase [Rhodothermales bacterium]|nr:argininosuccinate synthase [Rhodothermales bacterium]
MTKPIVLAFSGGLDTSYCIPWLTETFGRPVITVTVDTGGFDDVERTALEHRSAELGASAHMIVDANQKLFDDVIRFLIFGNVRKGEVYPLSVGAERSIQAEAVGKIATEMGADTIAHGCTAAGNDQVRFEIALRALYPEINIVAPVRDYPVTRAAQIEYLSSRSLPVPSHGAAYSINTGLWGTTIGGSETLGSAESIPEHAWPLSAGAMHRVTNEKNLSIEFQNGVPVAVDGTPMDPVKLITHLNSVASEFAIGRGVHLGDTILGIKGRVAFEAPAAETLLTAHRELEKLVLSAKQLSIKQFLANTYGELVHAGNALDPVCRDVEAFLESSQKNVTGEVFLSLRPGHLFVTGCVSPFSLMDASKSHYGETTRDWTAQDAAGFCKISSISAALHQVAATSPKEQEVQS